MGDVPLMGGVLLFPSVVAPEPDSSGPSRTYFYALEYRTGKTVRKGLGAWTPGGYGTATGPVPAREDPVVGMWTCPEPRALSGDDVCACLPLSTGPITRLSLAPVLPVESRYLSWLSWRDP